MPLLPGAPRAGEAVRRFAGRRAMALAAEGVGPIHVRLLLCGADNLHLAEGGRRRARLQPRSRFLRAARAAVEVGR